MYYNYSLFNETPFTFSSSLLDCYIRALDNIFKIDIEKKEKVLYENSKYLINEFKKCNYNTTLNTSLSNWIINFKTKKPNELYQFLLDRNIVVYKCKNILKNNNIQICIMNQGKQNIDFLINNIKDFNNN